jgi:hypothetical protein
MKTGHLLAGHSIFHGKTTLVTFCVTDQEIFMGSILFQNIEIFAVKCELFFLATSQNTFTQQCIYRKLS